MLSEIQKELAELNYLGSYIVKDDPFKEFEQAYANTLFSDHHQFETTNTIDFELLKQSLNDTILPRVKGKTPIVFLSGGIDSTVLAHTLFDNQIPFKAYAYFISEEDPGIKYIKYLDEKYGITTNLIIGTKEELRQKYLNYFQHYHSPNIDYACLTMGCFIDKIVEQENQTKDILFLDGIEGDNLLGYKNNFKLKVKSYLLNLLSGSRTNSRQFKSKKLNIYTGSVLRNYRYNSLYQNYILTKALEKEQLSEISGHLNNILISPKFGQKLSFHSHNMVAMLYYMGRRVAYKNYIPILNSGHEILYPFTEPKLVEFGYKLANSKKVKPVIKYPLKHYLEREGYSQEFVYSKKRGMSFDLFDIATFHELKECIKLLSGIFEFKPDIENYYYSLYKNRDKAIDHYLFALLMSGQYVKHTH